MADPGEVTEGEVRTIISYELSRLSLGRYTPKRFRVNVGSASMQLQGSLHGIEGLVRAAVEAERGHIVRISPGLIVAVVKSGAAHMNPAVVTARIEAEPGGSTMSVVLRGVAAEGLIKQHAGERAVHALRQRLEA